MNLLRTKNILIGLALMATGATLAPTNAHAFCGFYVSGGDAELFNDATQVVLMREGTKTVLSMQNNYKGPVKDFAMVVPVPVVLKQEDVKTLAPELFKKVDTLSAPRLVEYWEKDPCRNAGRNIDLPSGAEDTASVNASADNINNTTDPSVKVEAKFEVGEYDVVVLSATEANALETWLTDNKYNIPQGAQPIFNQYIQQGMYFFVAKINPAKVKFKSPGKMVLSPLRFAYDSPQFSLPIRLGMINAKDQQDLIVYILGNGQRYNVANYPNTTIPTNLEVSQDVKKDFGSFYVKLFDETVKATPNAVVTEYSWGATKCDPCPSTGFGATLNNEDLASLGLDVINSGAFRPSGWTLTRLHTRYSKDGIKDDLIFQKANAVIGGREVRNQYGLLERDARTDKNEINNFQGRYIMRNRWSGPISCDNPEFGAWGGPPQSVQNAQETQSAVSPNSGGKTAENLDNTPLTELIREDVDRIALKTTNPISGQSLGGCNVGGGPAVPVMLLTMVAGVGAFRVRRKKKN